MNIFSIIVRGMVFVSINICLTYFFKSCEEKYVNPRDRLIVSIDFTRAIFDICSVSLLKGGMKFKYDDICNHIKKWSLNILLLLSNNM